jgi:hypothetical protein
MNIIEPPTPRAQLPTREMLLYCVAQTVSLPNRGRADFGWIVGIRNSHDMTYPAWPVAGRTAVTKAAPGAASAGQTVNPNTSPAGFGQRSGANSSRKPGKPTRSSAPEKPSPLLDVLEILMSSTRNIPGRKEIPKRMENSTGSLRKGSSNMEC